MVTVSFPNVIRPRNQQCDDVSPQVGGILALDMAAHTGIATITAKALSFHPINGMAFGALYFAGSHGAAYLMQWLEAKVTNTSGNQTTFAKVTRFMIAFLSGITLGTAGCTFLGASIIFSVGLALTAAMLATTASIATFVFSGAQAKNLIIGPNLVSGLKA